MILLLRCCEVEKGVKYTINIWTFNQLKQVESTKKATKTGAMEGGVKGVV